MKTKPSDGNPAETITNDRYKMRLLSGPYREHEYEALESAIRSLRQGGIKYCVEVRYGVKWLYRIWVGWRGE